MSSDPFALLGLDRNTATEADIRKAYAERLKVTRPEDDREAFMALREAFERARQESLWRAEYSDEYDEEDEEQDAIFLDMEASAPLDGPVYADTENQNIEFHHSVAEFVRTLENAPKNTDLAGLAANLTNDPRYFSIDDFAELGASLRTYLCLKTGMEERLSRLPLPNRYWASWRDIWQFDVAYFDRHWPAWLTPEVFDILDQSYSWTRSTNFRRSERLSVDWLKQVRLELQWSKLPATQAMFHRLENAISYAQLKPTTEMLAAIMRTGPSGSDAEETTLSEQFRTLLLDATNFGVRSIVGPPPEWLTIEIYKSLEWRFNWSQMDQRTRRKVEREKKILQDLNRKRDKNVPENIRKTAWLEIVKEELIWKAKPASERHKRVVLKYHQGRFSEQLLIMVGFIPFLIVLFAIVITLMNFFEKPNY